MEYGETQVNLDEEMGGVQEVEKIGMDISEFVGKKVKIELIEERKGNIYKGRQSYYVLLKTEIVNPDEADGFKQIRATKILGLNTIQDQKGNLKVVWAKEGKTGLFLTKHQKTHYKDFEGVEVQLKPSEPKKDGIEYLTF